jgi:hypothetical protein
MDNLAGFIKRYSKPYDQDSQDQPHDVVGGTSWLYLGTLTIRRGDSKTVTKGLIVTGERQIEEIWVRLCPKPISFPQESAGVGLRPPARRAYASERYSGSTYNHLFVLREISLDRSGDLLELFHIALFHLPL